MVTEEIFMIGKGDIEVELLPNGFYSIRLYKDNNLLHIVIDEALAEKLEFELGVCREERMRESEVEK
jgi:hypothetical protein